MLGAGVSYLGAEFQLASAVAKEARAGWEVATSIAALAGAQKT